MPGLCRDIMQHRSKTDAENIHKCCQHLCLSSFSSDESSTCTKNHKQVFFEKKKNISYKTCFVIHTSNGNHIMSSLPSDGVQNIVEMSRSDKILSVLVLVNFLLVNKSIKLTMVAITRLPYFQDNHVSLISNVLYLYRFLTYPIYNLWWGSKQVEL